MNPNEMINRLLNEEDEVKVNEPWTCDDKDVEIINQWFTWQRDRSDSGEELSPEDFISFVADEDGLCGQSQRNC